MTEITHVAPHSPAFGKITPGEYLVAINGQPIQDVLDFQYHSYDAQLQITTKTPAGPLKLCLIKKNPGADLGLTFASYLMDHSRNCANNCIFCFVDQLPPGMRDSLYFKDDDIRLSFLMGNYITLTNLSQREIQRIIRLKISPIHISIHATDPEIRAKMLGNRAGARCMEIMEQFAAAGITLNGQIVLCPAVNDGVVLASTMADLEALCPKLNSVSVVPVGLTRYREGTYPLSPVTENLARKTIRQVEGFAAYCLKKHGSRIFFCSDELYLKANLPLPQEAAYEGYPQLENGVGLLTLFEAEFLAALENMAYPAPPPSFSIATGTSAAKFLQKLLETAGKKYGKMRGQVYAIENDFFGHSVTVAGLLTGRDLIAQLQTKALGERLLIPKTMFRHGEGLFLDDVTVEDLSRALGVPVIPVEPRGEKLVDTIFQ